MMPSAGAIAAGSFRRRPGAERSVRIAVISEILGNSWALESVLRDIRGRGVDRILNLGDSLFGPLAPLETAWRLRSRDVLSVRGRLDRLLAEPAGRSLPLLAALVSSRLDVETRRWLRQLPALRVFGSRIVLCPGCRAAEFPCLAGPGVSRPAWRRAAGALRRSRKAARDVVLCGRGPLFRKAALPGGAVIISPGSVGLPVRREGHPYAGPVATGSPHARYVLIEFRSGDCDVRPVAVEYPWDAAAAAALANGCPDWAVWLKTGRA